MKMEAGKIAQEIKSLVFKYENLICSIQEPCKKYLVAAIIRLESQD